MKEVATFYKQSSGYFTFVFENDEKIIFEEIDKKVLRKYNLYSKELLHKKFYITYTEIIDDILDDEFIIYRLNDLELI